jgi:hypothetical protein
MEYRIKYYRVFELGFGRGTFSADEQTIRLRGYSAARQRWWMISILWMVWIILSPQIGSQIRMFFGLAPRGNFWIDFIITLAPAIIGVLLVNQWPGSMSFEKFDKKSVTRVGRQKRYVSFTVPDPFKSGKVLDISFKANSIAEVDQIIEKLLEGQELPESKLPGSVSIPPETKMDILSGKISDYEIMWKYNIPAKQLRDIISGELSNQEIMIKYAMRAEELEEIHKKLENKA